MKLRKQSGIALPIALIMFTVMLITSLYLVRSSNSATLLVGNMAYERSIIRVTDYGLTQGYNWLSAAPSAVLSGPNQPGNAYNANYDDVTAATPMAAGFWQNSVTAVDPNSGLNVEYVIHRMCKFASQSPGGANPCIQSTSTQCGPPSLASDAPAYICPAQVHYVITSRVTNAARSTGAVNQMVVMIGA